MYVFYICDTEVKNFMNKILREHYFDNFELRTVEIQSFAKFDIDGKIIKQQQELDEETSQEETSNVFFCKWEKIRPYVFEFVKGKVKPAYMKFVISAPKELLEKISDNAAALFLNFVFEKDKVVCTTGTAQKTFALNKELDLAWEEYVKNFFKEIQIAVVED